MKISERRASREGRGFPHHCCAIDWLDPRNRGAENKSIVPQVNQAASKTQESPQARDCFQEPPTRYRQRLEATRQSRCDQAAEEKKVRKVVCLAPGRLHRAAYFWAKT